MSTRQASQYDSRRRQERMRKLPRSLRLYVAASTLYAALIFFAVQFIYTIELAQSGIVIARRDNGDVLSSIQLVSFIVWLGISLIAAVVLHRLATALAGAKSAEADATTSEEQKDQGLGSLFGLSSALAGPKTATAARARCRRSFAPGLSTTVTPSSSPTRRRTKRCGRRSPKRRRRSRARDPSPPCRLSLASASWGRSFFSASAPETSHRTKRRCR